MIKDSKQSYEVWLNLKALLDAIGDGIVDVTLNPQAEGNQHNSHTNKKNTED